jgi:hypothetical protein
MNLVASDDTSCSEFLATCAELEKNTGLTVGVDALKWASADLGLTASGDSLLKVAEHAIKENADEACVVLVAMLKKAREVVAPSDYERIESFAHALGKLLNSNHKVN